MLSRRSFLRASPVIALSAGMPLFVARSLRAASADKDARVLVVVELDGGNDALNTLVPHADDAYARLRPKLRLSSKRLVKVTDALGLHPALRPLDKLLDGGHLAVVSGVGYPNPNRSHFESMAIWRTARFDPAGPTGYGWLGRALDPAAGTLFSVGQDVPTALRGRRSSAVAFKRVEEVLLSDPAAARAAVGPEPADDLLAFVRREAVGAHAAADTIAQLSRDPGGPGYPATELADRLKLIARLLRMGAGARVFYSRQSGYDTHAHQMGTHGELLGTFAGAVAAFFADLKSANLADRVTLLAFSEFGRTVRENGSMGTDHGTAGVVFAAGPTVRGGVVGSAPNLTDLDQGEPKMTTDFRAVYAAVLETWLGLPPRDVLGGRFEPAALFRT